MPKKKVKIMGDDDKGGSWVEGGPSSSSSTLNKMENEELERATMKKYRRIIKDTNTSSMIVYRLNSWKEAAGGGGSLEDKYDGRIDFSVDLHSPNAYILSNSVIPRTPNGIANTQCVFCDHKKVSFCHCEIRGPNYPDDQIWIKGRSEYDRTFVNGNSIPKVKLYPLLDGDIIGLGAPHDSITDHWGEDRKKRGFVFKVRSLIRWEEQEQQNQDVNNGVEDIPSAFNNTVILSEILNFLSLSELKSARLVNQFWKGEADRKIFPRRLIRFETNFPFTCSMAEKYYFPSWEINLVDCNTDENKEFYEKILQLLKERGYIIRDVKLEISRHDEEGQRFISILRNLPKLETLRTYLRTCNRILANTATFPSVRHLWFDYEYLNLDLVEDMVVQAAKLFPNIEKFTSTQSLKHMLLPISKHNLWSTGLKEIGGRITSGDGERVYDIISALPQKLRKLELHEIPPFENPLEITSFENMLETHATTLEHLVLRFDMGRSWRRPKKKEESKPILKFPTFPKMKTFEFLLKMQEDFKFQIWFPSLDSGSICYEKDFPVIKELRLLPICSCPRDRTCAPYHNGDHWNFYCEFNKEAILDVFIPKDSDTVSRTMRWIEFRLDGKIRNKGNPWYEEFVDRFRKMFPYVHHPELNEKAEEGPKNGEGDEEPPPSRMRTRTRSRRP